MIVEVAVVLYTTTEYIVAYAVVHVAVLTWWYRAETKIKQEDLPPLVNNNADAEVGFSKMRATLTSV